MKKLALMSVLAVLCLESIAQWGDQNRDFREINEPFYTGSWIKLDVPLGNVINYKTTSIQLGDFKDKIIILGFWFTGCTDCIAQFPKEDSLQAEFADKIQIIMVTFDPSEKVATFLEGYKGRTGIALTTPIIVEDTSLSKAFRHLYDPHYAWIFPDGQIVAQSTQHFVTADNIRGLIAEWEKRKAFFMKLKLERDKALSGKN